MFVAAVFSQFASVVGGNRFVAAGLPGASAPFGIFKLLLKLKFEVKHAGLTARSQTAAEHTPDMNSYLLLTLASRVCRLMTSQRLDPPGPQMKPLIRVPLHHSAAVHSLCLEKLLFSLQTQKHTSP